MNRTIALVFGVVYLLVGILGFVLTDPNGYLLGLFAVNTLHHIVHLALGILGIGAAQGGQGKLYNQIAGVVLLLLGVLGFITPGLVGGLVGPGASANVLPDNLLHLVSGAILAYAGFAGPRETVAART